MAPNKPGHFEAGMALLAILGIAQASYLHLSHPASKALAPGGAIDRASAEILLLVLVAACLGGRGLVELLWSNRASGVAEICLRGSIGALSGLGLCSAAFEGLLLVGQPRASAARISGFLLLPLGVAASLIQRFRPRADPKPNRGGLPLGWTLFFWTGCALAAWLNFEHQRAVPEAGRNALVIQGRLLLTGLLHLGWTELNASTRAWPLALFWIAAALSVALLSSAVAVSRGARRGFAAGLVLATTPQFVLSPTSQQAELWIGCFVLAAQICVFHALQFAGTARLRLLALAGCSLGLAGCTKYEASLFGVALIAGLLLPHPAGASLKRRMIDAFAVLLGAVPLIAVVTLELTRAPMNQLFVSPQTVIGELQRAIDPARWAQLIPMLLRALVDFQAWTVGWVAAIAAAIFLWVRRTPFSLIRPSVRSLVLVWIGFALAYATSPSDLASQVGHSADRLLLQGWPSVLFLLSTAWHIKLVIQPST